MFVVTGGGGFIGSNIIAEMEARGLGPIVVCDELGADTRWRNLAKHTVHRFILPGDLGKFLRFRGQEVTAIICMGANSSTSETDAQALIDANIEPFRGVWNACARLHVPLIYASSASVYGLDPDGVDDDSPAALRALRPLNAYGWSKKVCDEYAAARPPKWLEPPPFWYGLRFFNVYGPNEGHKKQRSYVSKALEAGMRKGSIDLFPGDFARDWVYVLDVSRLVVDLIDKAVSPCARVPSGIYNVGSGDARGFDEIISIVDNALGSKIRVEEARMPSAMRSGYQPRTKANITKLQTAFPDFKPVRLEDGLAHYAFAFTGDGWDAYR